MYYLIENMAVQGSIYAVGMPYNLDGTRLQLKKDIKHNLILFILQTSVADPSCPLFQTIKYDIIAQHQTQFFANILDFQYHSGNLFYLTFAISDNLADLGKIGTSNHHIQTVLLNQASCALPGSRATITGFAEPMVNQKLEDSLTSANELTSFLNSKVLAFGRVCSSLSQTRSCTVIGANSMGGQLKYMVNTKERFVSNTGSVNDGMFTVPTTADGVVR